MHPTRRRPEVQRAGRWSGWSNIQVPPHANAWFDDDAGVDPLDFTTPPGSVCVAKDLDVKATESNSFPLASIIPLFPDLKRKARIQIQESAETSGPGLLPLAVRVPKPLTAAAVYVDETPGNVGQILSAVYFNDVCEPPANANCITGMPSGLDHWTTDNGSGGNRATITSMPSQVGVVVALSHRPKCPGAACFAINQPTIDQLCNQGTSAIAQCYYTTGTSTQTFQSGLQFIRSWSSNADAFPDLLSTWIEPPISGSFCYQGYFSAPVTNACTVTLRANVDPGFGGVGNTEIRYKHVAGNTGWVSDDPVTGGCNNNFGAQCVMVGGAASFSSPRLTRVTPLPSDLPLQPAASGHCRKDFPPKRPPTPQQACSWYYTPGRSMTDPSGNSGADLIFTARSSAPSWATSFAPARSSFST